jgi:hypothetical protein
MKKKLSIIILILVIIAIISAFVFEKDSREINAGNRISGTLVQRIPATDITYHNLASFLSRNAVVKDIPKNTKILLRFYNFNTGSRSYEKIFILERDQVSEGSINNPALYIDIHSKYLENWNSGNFCQIMANAKNNGDLGITSELSIPQLLWKFKGMNEHKSCFGL